MESQDNKNNPIDTSKKSAFIKWINEYKELLSVIIFFIGGFLWVYGVFATKEATKEQIEATKEQIKATKEATKKQNDITKCLLAENIQATKSQMDEFIFFQLLVKNLEEQQKIEKPSPGSDVDQKDLARLKAAETDIKNKLKIASESRQKSTDILSANKCSD